MNLYQKEFIEHAKINEQNMRISIIAGLSFQELRNFLIRDFCKAMKQALQVKGGILDTRSWEESPVGPYTGLKFRQSHWPEWIFVRISGETGGLRDYIVGVDADASKVKNEYRVAITEKLNSSLSICSKPTVGWPWYRNLDARYRNFDCEETLLALYRKDQMVIDLVGCIVDISKYLDSLFQVPQLVDTNT